MHHDPFGSGHGLDLRSSFEHDFLRSNYCSFDVPRQKKYDAGKINVVLLLSQKLLQKNVFRKNGYFCLFVFGDQTVDLRSNPRASAKDP